jgi:rod shape determining protein RodA
MRLNIDRQVLWQIDWQLVLITLIICTIGVLTIRSATVNMADRDYAFKQVTHILLGLAVATLVVLFDHQRLLRFQAFIYLGTVVLLIVLLVKGGAGGRVDRYFKLPFLPAITPSEFLKFALILQFASCLRGKKLSGIQVRDIGWPLAGLGLGLILILKQPDLGTALLLIPVFGLQLLIAGFDLKKFGLAIVILAIVGGFSARHVLKPYQWERLTSFMRQHDEKSEGNWQLRQSKVAIGSGGWFGRGYLQGTQAKLEFLPAKHTDFILAVFAEEWGFVGVLSLFFLYIWWIWRALRIARHAPDPAGLLLAVGVCGLVITQFLFNAGMIVGLLPITGLTLPFMSYGGSSLLTNMTSLGILLSVGMRRA